LRPFISARAETLTRCLREGQAVGRDRALDAKGDGAPSLSSTSLFWLLSQSPPSLIVLYETAEVGL
jgi:hypothetical protein